jgi:hypothetical protein
LHSSFWAPMKGEDFTIESISPARSFFKELCKQTKQTMNIK